MTDHSFCDAEGIAGIRFNNTNYRFVRDAMGNVSKVYPHQAAGKTGIRRRRIQHAEY